MSWVTVSCAFSPAGASVAAAGGRGAGPLDREDGGGGQVRELDAATAFGVAKGADASAVEGTELRYYHSSEKVTRTFCGRCGTHLSFTESGYMGGLVDVVLGTVERGVLEERWMMPSRQCWCDAAMGWVRGLCGLEGEVGREGWDAMGRHPGGEYNEYC